MGIGGAIREVIHRSDDGRWPHDRQQRRRRRRRAVGDVVRSDVIVGLPVLVASPSEDNDERMMDDGRRENDECRNDDRRINDDDEDEKKAEKTTEGEEARTRCRPATTHGPPIDANAENVVPAYAMRAWDWTISRIAWAVMAREVGISSSRCLHSSPRGGGLVVF